MLSKTRSDPHDSLLASLAGSAAPAVASDRSSDKASEKVKFMHVVPSDDPILDKYKNIEFWHLVRNPQEGSLIDLLGKSDMDVEEWVRSKGVDEFVAALAASDLPLSAFIANRFVLPYQDAVHISSLFGKKFPDSQEYAILSSIVGEKISDRAQLFKLLKKIISFHPSLVGKVRKMLTGSSLEKIFV
jgi:hypothetical protein